MPGSVNKYFPIFIIPDVVLNCQTRGNAKANQGGCRVSNFQQYLFEQLLGDNNLLHL